MVELTGITTSQKILVWNIKHIQEILLGIIVCVTLFLITFSMLYSGYVHPCSLGLLLIFVVAAFVLYMFYKEAKRYNEILTALGPDLISVQFIYEKIMKFTSSRFGEFFMDYYPGNDSENPYYGVWIVLDKPRVRIDRRRTTLWSKPSWFKRTFGDPPKPHHSVPLNLVTQIKTLRKISIEGYNKKYRIVAILNDDWLYSETHDLLRTVEVLEYIWAKI